MMRAWYEDKAKEIECGECFEIGGGIRVSDQAMDALLAMPLDDAALITARIAEVLEWHAAGGDRRR